MQIAIYSSNLTEEVIQMNIKIIADSSCDMPADLKSAYPYTPIPFKLYVDDEEMVDDETLNPIDFIEKMVKSSGVPRSACPSPIDFQNHFEGDEKACIVTISSRLSGTYNSAMLAKSMYLEEHPEKEIHIFDSKSASIGETLVVLKIHELSKESLPSEVFAQKVNDYIDSMKTYFVSESLENLMKNGRISRFKGTIASALNIKPIMGADANGEIQLVEKARGSAKAFQRMLELIIENATDAEHRILAISHVNNPERAHWLCEEVKRACKFKDVIVVQTGGLSSLYCDHQGVIVSF